MGGSGERWCVPIVLGREFIASHDGIVCCNMQARWVPMYGKSAQGLGYSRSLVRLQCLSFADERACRHALHFARVGVRGAACDLHADEDVRRRRRRNLSVINHTTPRTLRETHINDGQVAQPPCSHCGVCWFSFSCSRSVLVFTIGRLHVLYGYATVQLHLRLHCMQRPCHVGLLLLPSGAGLLRCECWLYVLHWAAANVMLLQHEHLQQLLRLCE
jgi:hypothetical protein